MSKLHWDSDDVPYLYGLVRGSTTGLTETQAGDVVTAMIDHQCGVWHAVHIALKTATCNCFPCRQAAGLEAASCGHGAPIH